VKDQVSHPYKTTEEIVSVYFNLEFVYSANWKTDDTGPCANQEFPEFC